MIALFLALQAAPAPPAAPAAPAPDMPAALPRQSLPARGCAAYLWNRDERRLVAMAIADPATLRLSLRGVAADYPRAGQSGVGGYGFAGTTVFRLGDVTATLDLTIAPRADLADGATVPDATLTIVRDGGDALVLPVGGLIGCAPAR